MSWTMEQIERQTGINRCRECDGVGHVEEQYAAGVSWATPFGFPEYRTESCDRCNGSGEVEDEMTIIIDDIDHERDLFTVEELLAEYRWSYADKAFVSAKVDEDRAEHREETRQRIESESRARGWLR